MSIRVQSMHTGGTIYMIFFFFQRKIDNMTIYVTEKFKRKECVKFVQDPKQKDKQK